MTSATVTALVIGWAIPVAAQAPFVAGSIADSAACALHVWPAGPIDAVTQGDLWNHTVNQAFDPARGGVARPDVLAVDSQRALLAEIGLADLLGLGGAQLVIHVDQPPRVSAITGRAPLAAVETECHVELIVARIFYDRAPLAGRSLKSLITIRQFRPDGQIVASYTTWGETALIRFPPKPGDDLAAADAELVAAYLANLRQVATLAAIAPDRKGRRRPAAGTLPLPQPKAPS